MPRVEGRSKQDPGPFQLVGRPIEGLVDLATFNMAMTAENGGSAGRICGYSRRRDCHRPPERPPPVWLLRIVRGIVRFTVDAFVREVLTTYLAKELKGRPVPLEPAARRCRATLGGIVGAAPPTRLPSPSWPTHRPKIGAPLKARSQHAQHAGMPAVGHARWPCLRYEVSWPVFRSGCTNLDDRAVGARPARTATVLGLEPSGYVDCFPARPPQSVQTEPSKEDTPNDKAHDPYHRSPPRGIRGADIRHVRNFALFSCAVNGDGFTLQPLFVSVTPGMTLRPR